jgi:bacteriocin biosynthesis cyclodehydratase domain-containing protein
MVLLLVSGAFGHRVGHRLAADWPDTTTFDLATHGDPAAWPAPDLIVVAADRPPAVVAEVVDRAAFAWRRPWFPVLLDEPYLRCGPVVVPGRSACHRCFTRRRRQHAQAADAWTDPTTPALPGTAARVSGFADHHVDLAVGLARQARRDAAQAGDGPLPAWVRTVRLTDGVPSRAAVVAVDGCDRCRPPRDPDRGLRDLVAALDLDGNDRRGTR